MSNMSNMNEFFGEGGILSKHLENHKVRPGQICLANEVDTAIRDKRHLLAEGPTGTGKSLAYSIPAGLHALEGKRVVIATANITLQEQLNTKDLPFVSKILPRKKSGAPLSFVLFKGVGNYLCKRRFHKRVKGMREGVGPYAHELGAIIAWERVTRSGDKSELERTPPTALWNDINGSHDAGCLGRRCPNVKSCYIRARDMDKDIVVCNYHILFTDILLGIEAGTGILPPYDILIMDEAHGAPEIAMDFYGWQLTERAIIRAVKHAPDIGEQDRQADILDESEDLFKELSNRCKLSSILQNRASRPGLRHTLEILGNAYGAKAADLGEEWDEAFQRGEQELSLELAEESFKYSRLSKACNKYSQCIDEIGEAYPGKHRVYNMEKRDWNDPESQLQLQCKVVETGPFFAEHVFDKRLVIAMSATLTTGGNFNFIAKRFGLKPKDYRATIAPSPFDPGNVMVYVPSGRFPEPSTGNAHAEAVADDIYDIVKGIGGRTMALFTSYRNLNTATKILRKHLYNTDFHIFVQGELPQMRLISEFMAADKAIILATASFWKGVDIPGKALSCVLIDKIPFARPDNPVLYYLENSREESAFTTYSIPQAIIMLKQGMGRLIRRESDYGAIAIMDPRINVKGYGKRIRSAFPDDCWLTDDWQDVVEFIQEMDGGIHE